MLQTVASHSKRLTPVMEHSNYQLVSDNVLDVTHLAYVHATSIGASSITEFPATVERFLQSAAMDEHVLAVWCSVPDAI